LILLLNKYLLISAYYDNVACGGASHNKRLAFRRPFGRLQGYGLLGRSGYALALTQASTHIFAALRAQKLGKNEFKAFGLAYSGSKNVANLERYVKLVLNWIKILK